NATDPFEVAEVIHHAVTTDEPRLRYVTSWGAAELIQGRDRMTDADWVALGAALDDAAYYARFEELLGLDIRPGDGPRRLGGAGWVDAGLDVPRLRPPVRPHPAVARLCAGDDAGRVLRHRTAAREAGVRCGDAPPRTRGPGLRGARVRGDLPEEPAQVRRAAPAAALDRTVVLSAAPGGPPDHRAEGGPVRREIPPRRQRRRAAGLRR